MKQNHSMGKIFIIVVTLFLSCIITADSRAYDDLCKQVACDRNLSSLIKHDIMGICRSYSLGGKISDRVVYSVRVNKKSGDVFFEFTGDITKVKSIMDSSLTLKEDIKHINPAYKELVTLIGWDKREMLWERNKREVRIIYYLNDKEIKRKKITYEKNLLDAEHLTVYLQCLLMSGFRGDFDTDVVLGAKGWKLGVELRLIKAHDLSQIDTKYVLPKDMEAAVRSGDEYYVYELSFSGFVGFFVRIKYYFAFSRKYPHHFIAYWGGQKGYEEYVFLIPEAMK